MTPYIFKKTVGFFKKAVVVVDVVAVFTQIALKLQPEFLLSILFSNWPRRLNLSEKARFLENLHK